MFLAKLDEAVEACVLSLAPITTIAKKYGVPYGSLYYTLKKPRLRPYAMPNHLTTPIAAFLLLSSLPAAAGPVHGEKYIPVKKGVTTTVRTSDHLAYALWKDLPIEFEYIDMNYTLGGGNSYFTIKPTGEIRCDNGILLITEWGDVHFYRLQETEALKIPRLKTDKESFRYHPVQQGDTVRLSPSLITVMEVPYKVFRYSFASKNLPISVKDVTPYKLKSLDDSFEKLVYDTDRTFFRFEFPDTLAAGYTDSLALTDILGVDHTFIVEVDPEKTYPYVRDCTDGPQPVAEEEKPAEEPENYKGLALALLLLLGTPIALGILIASTQRKKRIRKEELEKRFAKIEGSVQETKDTIQRLRFNLGREIREDLKKVIDRDVEAIIATKADKLRELINPSLEQYNQDIDRKTAQAQAQFQKNINDILRQKISEINLMELAERAVGQYTTLQLNKAISDEVSRKIGLITAKSSIELSEAERQKIVASVTKTLTEEYHKLIDRVNQRKAKEYENDLKKTTNQEKLQIIADLTETIDDIFAKKKKRYMNLELDDPLSDYIKTEIARQIRNFFIYNYGFLPITEIEPTEEQ